MCYFQLCREDHRWWWRSFNNTGFAGVYVYIYAAIYARSELQLSGLTARLLYYGYMGAVSIGCYLMAVRASPGDPPFPGTACLPDCQRRAASKLFAPLLRDVSPVAAAAPSVD